MNSLTSLGIHQISPDDFTNRTEEINLILGKQINILNNTVQQFISRSKNEEEGNKDLINVNGKITKTYNKLFNTLLKGQKVIVNDLNLGNKLGLKKNRTKEMTFHL